MLNGYGSIRQAGCRATHHGDEAKFVLGLALLVRSRTIPPPVKHTGSPVSPQHITSAGGEKVQIWPGKVYKEYRRQHDLEMVFRGVHLVARRSAALLAARMHRWLVSCLRMANLKLSADWPLVPRSRAKGGRKEGGGTMHTMPHRSPYFRQARGLAGSKWTTLL